MRIAIFTEEDYTFMFEGYRRLVARLESAGHTVVGLFVFPTKLGKYTGFGMYAYYLKTFGLVVFLKLILATLRERVHQLSQSMVSGQPLTYRSLAAKHNFYFKEAKNPNDVTVVEWVQKNNIDVILSTHGFIIKTPLIAAVRQTILNKHSSLLPSSRGLFPVFWTMLKNLGPVGATIHCIDASIDTGKILYQKQYPALEPPTVFCYYKKIFDDLDDSFLTGLKILEGQTAEITLNTHSSASYFSLPTRADYQEFRRRGFKFI